MTAKFDVSILFLFNVRELLRDIKCTVYFTWNTWTSSVLLKGPIFYSNEEREREVEISENLMTT
jgi:hypothetical protein